jgi:predicted transcriptional regulator
MTNEDKILQAVLMNERLMEFGNYNAAGVSSIYEALASDNFVVNTVAQIIKRIGEKATEKELWKEVNDYLKRNV